MRRLNTVTEIELLEIYDLVFNSIHSDSFKKSEVKDLFTNSYWFLEKPKINWKESLIVYLKERNLETPEILK